MRIRLATRRSERYASARPEIMHEEKTRLQLSNQVEASLLDVLLQQDGVPHFVHSYHDRAYDGLWQFQSGWGYVETPSRYADGVRALLELIRHNRLSTT